MTSRMSDPAKRHEKQFTTSFTYNRLGEGEVRILKLYPAENFDDEIVCDLDIHAITHCPRYEALSYAWGPETDMHHDIYINQDTKRRVVVRQNLHQALRNLRDRHEKRSLWIDALCINQDDLVERSEQVRIMYKIYREACSAIVWLGDASLPGEQDTGFNSFTLGPHTTTKTGLDDPVDLAYRAAQFQKILRRPWFSRRWVIQEVLMAKEVNFQCGQQRTPREQVERAFTSWNRQGEFIHMPIFTLFGRSVFWGGHDIFDVLILFNNSECFDDRDRLFSLLNCGSEESSYRPDYTMSTEQAYTDFACHMILDGYGPRVLVSASVRQQPKATDAELLYSPSKHLPSWVPDWRLPVPSSIYSVCDCAGIFERRLSKESTGKWDVQLRSGRYILCVTARLLGFVSRTWEEGEHTSSLPGSFFETDTAYKGYAPRAKGLLTLHTDGEENQPHPAIVAHNDDDRLIYHDDAIIAFEGSTLAFVVRSTLFDPSKEAYKLIKECRLDSGHEERARNEPLQNIVLV